MLKSIFFPNPLLEVYLDPNKDRMLKGGEGATFIPALFDFVARHKRFKLWLG